MSVAFDPNDGLVVVATKLTGPTGAAILRLAVDTGATGTIVNRELLTAIGYDLDNEVDEIEVTTGSGVETAPRIAVARIEALGQSIEGFPILGHTLPPSAGVDGLLGLDYFRDSIVTINFRTGTIDLK